MLRSLSHVVEKVSPRKWDDAHESGINYEQNDSTLWGEERYCISRICSLRKYDPKPRGGSKSRILDEDAIHYLMEKIEQRPDISNKNVSISIASSSRILDFKPGLWVIDYIYRYGIFLHPIKSKYSARNYPWLMSIISFRWYFFHHMGEAAATFIVKLKDVIICII